MNNFFNETNLFRIFMSLMMFLLLAFVNSKADSADLMILRANVDSYKENILEIRDQLREIRQDLKDMSRKK